MTVNSSSCNEYPVNTLSLGAETVVRLLSWEGNTITAWSYEDGMSRAESVVETENGDVCVLQIPPSLYGPLTAAGAVAGQWYLITRNANAARSVYKVKAITTTQQQKVGTDA